MEAIEDLLNLTPDKKDTQNIALDPQNPRLLDLGLGRADVVPDENILDPELQESLQSDIEKIGIEDIKPKIRRFGYLPIDRVVVRRLDGTDDKYVVLEGNRRIAAIKSFQPNELAAMDDKIRESLQQIPVLIYEGNDPDIAWHIQGFRHITSVKNWGPYQQAKFLSLQLEKGDGTTITDVAKAAGIGRNIASRLVRSFHGFEQARETTDHGEDLQDNDFAYFREAIFHKLGSATSEWLEWDDNNRKFTHEDNLNKLVQLIKEKQGDPPLPRITRAIDLRDKFPYLLNTDSARELQQFIDGNISLDQAYEHAKSETDERQTIRDLSKVDYQFDRLEELHSIIQTLPIVKIKDTDWEQRFAKLLIDIRRTSESYAKWLKDSD